MKGVKHDNGKRLWRLFRLSDFEPAVKVGEFGAKKYDLHNWKYVEDTQRYEDALLRHIAAWQDGELVDLESGLPHLAHVLWNSVVLCWFERQAIPAIYATKANEPKKKKNGR